MSIPLLPLGDSVLGGLGWQAVERLNPGSFLQQLLGIADGESPEVGGKTAESESSNSRELSSALPEFVANLRQRLASAGVTLAEPLALKDDGDGGIMVDGEHPDRLAIEELLQGDAELQAEFRELAQTAVRLRDQQPAWYDSHFAEFRLHLTPTSFAVGFE